MTNQHTMKLSSKPFDKIYNGTKIIESRLYDEKRQILKLGDEITFCRESEDGKRISAQIVALLRYNSFSELFEDFPSEWFGGSYKEELLEEIRQFYSEKDERKNGVIGIKIKNIK